MCPSHSPDLDENPAVLVARHLLKNSIDNRITLSVDNFKKSKLHIVVKEYLNF